MRREFVRKYKVASLFCGIGGSDLGMLGGFSYLGKEYCELPFEIAYAVDFDANVVETYNKNFRHKAVCADVRNEDFSKLPDIDIMIGGFPCQSFSSANKGRNSTDDRALLYKQIVRFLQTKQPQFFICENVKGLITLDKGETFKRIKKEFEGCGYTVKWQLLNAVDYSIPQRRERVIIVGQKGTENDYEFPYPHLFEQYVPLRKVIDPLSDIDKKLYFSKKAVDGASKGSSVGFKWMKAMDLDEPCTTITAHLSKVTLKSQDPVLCMDKKNNKWRRFSIREAGRIQSFPDTFIFSDVQTKAYKQIGNAVPPVLMWEVANELTKLLD